MCMYVGSSYKCTYVCTSRKPLPHPISVNCSSYGVDKVVLQQHNGSVWRSHFVFFPTLQKKEWLNGCLSLYMALWWTVEPVSVYPNTLTRPLEEDCPRLWRGFSWRWMKNYETQGIPTAVIAPTSGEDVNNNSDRIFSILKSINPTCG